jgi:hypothetical protein
MSVELWDGDNPLSHVLPLLTTINIVVFVILTSVVFPTNYHHRYCNDHIVNIKSEKSGHGDSAIRDFFTIYIFQLKMKHIIYEAVRDVSPL